MESMRQQKFARQVQKDMSEIFQREGRQMFGNQFISVSQVRVTPDLGYAKVYLTFLNEKDPQRMLNLIRQYNKELRTMLASRIRNEVRKIPEIEFFYDDTLDFVEKIDRLLDDVKKKDSGKQGEEDQ